MLQTAAPPPSCLGVRKPVAWSIQDRLASHLPLVDPALPPFCGDEVEALDCALSAAPTAVHLGSGKNTDHAGRGHAPTRATPPPTRCTSPFRLPPSVVEMAQSLTSDTSSSDTSERTSSPVAEAIPAEKEKVAKQEKVAWHGGCAHCGIAIVGDMPVYCGFDRKFCCQDHRESGLVDEMRAQSLRAPDQYVEYVHQRAPSLASPRATWAVVQRRSKCARVR